MKTRVLLLLMGSLACRGTDPGEMRPASVLWMEWPAEVVANQPYQVRVVIPPLCDRGQLVFRQVPSDGALLFDARYENVRPSEWGCEPAGPIYGVETRDVSPIGGVPRALEVRGSQYDGSQPRFGDLAIVAGDRDTTISAAGLATVRTAASGCSRIVPGGYQPNYSSYQFEGDTAGVAEWPPVWMEGKITRGRTACAGQAGDTLIFTRTLR